MKGCVFGFSSSLAERIKSPYSGMAWMARELIEHALCNVEGSVTYPSAFDEVD